MGLLENPSRIFALRGYTTGGDLLSRILPNDKFCQDTQIVLVDP